MKRTGFYVMLAGKITLGLLSLCCQGNEGGKVRIIRGHPGIDYPDYREVPETPFSCRDHLYEGLYADVDAQCQVYRYCYTETRMESFLCPSGTVFNQKIQDCDLWHRVKCKESSNYYYLNAIPRDFSKLLHIGAKLQSLRQQLRPEQAALQPQDQNSYLFNSRPQQANHQPESDSHRPQDQTSYQSQRNSRPHQASHQFERLQLSSDLHGPQHTFLSFNPWVIFGWPSDR
ncbi:uncharacterized protein LOC143247116 isoform X2 [Tachypleus tridentatus]|uniref:uncharacterized protein LOC143247116 isoform X2 n=1 Tax=Tachypleus tridentatus TaxID=6853 RepID=UPI003FD0DCF5